MNTRIRSIGFAAFGAVALTMVSMEEPQNVIGCTPGGILTSQECQFETLVWELAKDSPDESDIESYISLFPNGRYLVQAKQRLSGMLPRYDVVESRRPQS